MVNTIKLPFTSDGMKAVWIKDTLKAKTNDCAGEFVLRPLRLKVVTWYYIFKLFSEFLCYNSVVWYSHTPICGFIVYL